MLKAQAEGLPAQEAKIAAVAVKIPAEPSLPALIDALKAAGVAAGVELVQLTPGAPEAVAVPAAAAAAPAGADADTATAAAAAAPAASGLVRVPLTIGVAGGYLQTERFVAALEDLPRAMRVTGLSVAPGSSPTASSPVAVKDGKVLLSTITAEVFTSAALAAATGAAAPAAQAGATAPSVPAASAAAPAQ